MRRHVARTALPIPWMNRSSTPCCRKQMYGSKSKSSPVVGLETATARSLFILSYALPWRVPFLHSVRPLRMYNHTRGIFRRSRRLPSKHPVRIAARPCCTVSHPTVRVQPLEAPVSGPTPAESKSGLAARAEASCNPITSAASQLRIEYIHQQAVQLLAKIQMRP